MVRPVRPASRMTSPPTTLYRRIREILESGRAGVARSVNTTQVVANWLIGREIVEEEKRGRARAGYGRRLIEALSRKLATNFGTGYSVQNLFYMVPFYRTYPALVSSDKILHAVRGESREGDTGNDSPMVHAPSGASGAVRRKSLTQEEQPEFSLFPHAVRGESWLPGRLHPNLSWTHYRTLLRVDEAEARAFYEIEAIKNNWSARELDRQINSLLHDRLALSRDKKGLMRLAVKGHLLQRPDDIFKDPVVMEFLGLSESPKLVRTGPEHLRDLVLQTHDE